VAERGDSAVVYDPATEYIQKFFDAERGDVVLNPLDARCPYWGPAQEIESNAEADAVAASLYQPTGESKDEFFHQTPAQIFAHLLKYGPTPHQLADWLASDKELLAKVEGTEMAFYIDQNAGPQRAGVLSSLGIVAKSFRLLPTKKEAQGEWNARSWSKTRKGWVFITSRPTERNTLRPLHSLWIDLLVMRLMNEPAPNQKTVWFVIDELASLQRLPQLHTALTEARKSKNPMVLGFQGRAQLQAIYGDKLAEVMVSQPATKLFMKTAEPNAAQWISKAIGYVEIERVKETKHDGAKHGRNYSLDRQIEPLVMESQITGLDDLHAYLKHGNNVARFDFKYVSLPKSTPGFVSRAGAEGELMFDPDTLKPRPPKTPVTPKEADAPAEPEPSPATPVAPAVAAETVDTEPAETVAPVPGGEVGTAATEHRKTRKSRKKVKEKEAEPEPEKIEETVQEECLFAELNQQNPAPGKRQAQQPNQHNFIQM
ncbi:MAG: type IV secretion system DNA-binding domain-containing protein, partial [Janthinobacterium lividum]